MEKNCKTCDHITDVLSEHCASCINLFDMSGELMLWEPAVITTDSVVSQGGKREMFEKVYVNGKEENLPKVAGTYIVCKKSGEIYRDWRYISIDGEFPDANMWLNRMDWWLRPVE
jgi:RNA polymerase subunit RPABC4/transcription elongation factor Spt4